MRPGTSRNIGSLVLILPNSKGLLPQKISDGRSMLLGVTSLQKMCSISSCNIAVQRGGGLSGTFGGKAGRWRLWKGRTSRGTYVAPICSPYSKLVLQALDEQCFRCIVEGYVSTRVPFGDLCPD